MEKLARRGTASVVGAGFSAVFGVLLVVVVTNGFSPTVAGTLFAATSTFLILESVALLGTDTGLVRVLPGHLATGRAADVRRTLVIAAVPVVALSVGAAAGLHALAPTLAPYLVGPEAPTLMSEMLRALALVLPIAALHDLVLAGTRGMGSMRPTVIVENIGRLGFQALAVLVAFLFGADALLLALAWSLPYLAGLVASYIWLRRLVAARVPRDDDSRSWGVLVREFWSYTAPRAVARVTQTALKRSDIVLVAALASPAEAALYTAATRFVVLGQLFVQSVQQALSPQLSTLFTRGETRAANSVFQAATLWSMLVAWPLYLVLATWAPILMGVFGEGYGVASDVVLILALTMLLATACGPVDSVLLMAGHSWLSLVNSTITLAVNVGLNLILIPLQGIRGAAIAWSVAIVVRNLLPLVQVHRHLAMWPLTTTSGRVGIGAVVCFGGPGVLGALLALPLWLETFLLFLGVLLYATFVWAKRGALGLDAFHATIRRRSMPRAGAAPAKA
ncbi:polysaccharide biosynthesis C-terminal domain-containing protein [Nocardioides sp. Soil777]|uniref:MATE family efflux transporter n=1 Tax=Nocardioides sp. Soil777 TaxID=1736409 RepID=UPI00138F8DE1|nr:polysaccharide biosynthesis C-terminal domain-containing protein [Nocardioides sp. Soil777]